MDFPKDHKLFIIAITCLPDNTLLTGEILEIYKTIGSVGIRTRDLILADREPAVPPSYIDCSINYVISFA